MQRPIPLNALTLYADLDQSLAAGAGVPGTISRRQENGQRRLYATIREGSRRRQVYLGTVGDREAEASAQLYRADMEQARQRRSTVSALKRLGIPAPPLEAGRVLETLSRAGLFEAGGVLVGTTAYQCYPCIVGHMLPSASLVTRDVDLSIARIAVPRLSALGRPLEEILQEADPSFRGDMRGEQAPKSYRNRAGFSVDLLTTPGRRDEPVLVKGLGAFAVPLPFMDFLIAEPISAVALYGRGVRVTLPSPARFALHKLLIARHRTSQRQKAPKDVAQAWALIEALGAFDADALADGLDAARRRGGDLKAIAAEVEVKLATTGRRSD